MIPVHFILPYVFGSASGSQPLEPIANGQSPIGMAKLVTYPCWFVRDEPAKAGQSLPDGRNPVYLLAIAYWLLASPIVRSLLNRERA